jgi:3-hydroxyisobutyrate dehydrogenase
MVGGDAVVLDDVRWALDRLGSRIVHLGPVGSGHAVKAVSNALLATTLWATGEGLAALVAQGVSATAALEAFNGSAGRSNATERLFPERVVTREFPTTFALGLLAKDVRLAGQVLDSGEVDGAVLGLVRQLTDAAATQLGGGVDHSALVQVIEAAAGVEIR